MIRSTSGKLRRGFVRSAMASVVAGLTLSIAAPLPAAHAQSLRKIPPTARYGVFEMRQYPEASIDGLATRLSAGARIRDSRNMIVMPASVTGRHEVLYERDLTGHLSTVWILAPDEI